MSGQRANRDGSEIFESVDYMFNLFKNVVYYKQQNRTDGA